MAFSADENHAKIASFIAPKGGKQSAWLYAVRLLARGATPDPVYPSPLRWREKAGAPLSRHVCPRVPLLLPRSGDVTNAPLAPVWPRVTIWHFHAHPAYDRDETPIPEDQQRFDF